MIGLQDTFFSSSPPPPPSLFSHLSLSLSLSLPQLHSMLSDEGSQVMEQFSVFVEQLSPVHISADQRLPLEMAYQRKIEGMLANENCFKLKFVGWAANEKIFTHRVVSL